MYIPTEDDIEKAIQTLKIKNEKEGFKGNGSSSIPDILQEIERSFIERNLVLHKNWKMYTESEVFLHHLFGKH